MQYSVAIQQTLRLSRYRRHNFTSLAHSWRRSLIELNIRKDWESVVRIAATNDVLHFIKGTISKSTPMLPDDKVAIDTIFESSQHFNANAQFSHHIAEPLLTNGYDKYQLIASVGPDMATKLCYLESVGRLSVQHQAIASSINDESIASNLVLLDFAPPSTSEYLLAGHLQTYLRLLGDNNYGLLKRTFWSSLNTIPDCANEPNAMTRVLLIQLMAARQERVNQTNPSISTVPGQLVAAALQRVIELHGLAAGTKLLETICESVDLLPTESISSLAYSVMLNAILFKNSESTSLSSRKKQLLESDLLPAQHAALYALLKLSQTNATAAVELRAVLLKTLIQYNLHHTANSLASLCVQEYRWLGSDTINALAAPATTVLTHGGIHFPRGFLQLEQTNLTYLVSLAEAIYSQVESEALVLPAAVTRIRLAGQEFVSSVDSAQTSAVGSVDFDHRLLLQVSTDGTLDIDALLPPPELTVGLTVNTLRAQLSVIEQNFSQDLTTGRESTIRRLLESVNALQTSMESARSEAQEHNSNSESVGCDSDTMDILVRVARLGEKCHSILVVNKVVDLAQQLGQLPDRSPEECKYSWQLPRPPSAVGSNISGLTPVPISMMSDSVVSLLNTSFSFPAAAEAEPVVTPLLCWEEEQGIQGPYNKNLDRPLTRYTSITAESAAAAVREKARAKFDNNLRSGSDSSSNTKNKDKDGLSNEDAEAFLLVHPSVSDMQLLLQAQFATIRHINSLSLMQKAFGYAARCDIPLNVRMAHDAVNVFLFWKVHSNVRGIFASLEQTQGPRRALHMAQDLLLSLVTQDRLLDAAKVTLEVVRLQRAVDRDDTDGNQTVSANDSAQAPVHMVESRKNVLRVTFQRLLQHLVLRCDDGQANMDQGRHVIDTASATDALAAIVLHNLHRLDSPSAPAAVDGHSRAAWIAANHLGEIAELLSWFHDQQLRHPALTATVADAVRVVVKGHERGSELVELLDAIMKGGDSPQKTTDAKVAGKLEISVTAQPASVQALQSIDPSKRFEAYTYDNLEMHDNDSGLEKEYLKIALHDSSK